MSEFAKQSALWDATAIKMVANMNIETDMLNETKNLSIPLSVSTSGKQQSF